jgi:hypothetical protein
MEISDNENDGNISASVGVFHQSIKELNGNE